MTVKRLNARPKARAEPGAKPGEKRQILWVDGSTFDSLECKGYTTLDRNPEIMTAVGTIAQLIGSMTIHVMQNTPDGDRRVQDAFSRRLDVEPNPNMTRANFVRWIVETMLLSGHGNAVVVPQTSRGYLEALEPVPPELCSFVPRGETGYAILINGREYDPDSVLHFVERPGSYYPWLGLGYGVQLSDVANNLKQAAATEKGFMSSKYKPSLIVKVDALTEEFAGPTGRKKLLDEYIESGEAGAPWLIPAAQFDVQQVKPLSLSDLALADFVKLDKTTVASILGIPPFVLGVGEFKAAAWNNFINTKLRAIAQNIQQEMTKKLIYSAERYIRFNAWSLYAYSIQELVQAGSAMVDRLAMRRNEWRDWLNLPPDDDMEELIALENYIPADRLGDQKKLISDGGEGE